MRYTENFFEEGIVVDKNEDFYLVVDDTSDFHVIKSLEKIQLQSYIYWNKNEQIYGRFPTRIIPAMFYSRNEPVENWFEPMPISS